MEKFYLIVYGIRAYSIIWHVSSAVTIKKLCPYFDFNPVNAWGYLKSSSSSWGSYTFVAWLHQCTCLLLITQSSVCRKKRELSAGWGKRSTCNKECSQCQRGFQQRSTSPVCKGTVHERVVQCLVLWTAWHTNTFSLEHQHEEMPKPFSHSDAAVVPPLSVRHTAEDLRWMPGTMDSTKPCINYVFLIHTYLQWSLIYIWGRVKG